ncbi:MAG: DUF2087 domain-containing protein [Clostridia bacterium]|nr:DUF2087 domain-containing protein [Clostridia bacterium]
MEIDFLKELKSFMDSQGRLKQFPRKQKPREIALAYLAEGFEYGRIYSEKEVNAILNLRHTFNDSCMLRRELFERGYLGRTRNGAEYWLLNARQGKSGSPQGEAG